MSLFALALAASLSAPNISDWSTEDRHVDLEFTVAQLREHHPALYSVYSREVWNRKIQALEQDLDELDDIGFYVRLQGIVSLAADGHTNLSPSPELARQWSAEAWPLRFRHFEDGLFVTAAGGDLKPMVGGRVVKIGGVDCETVVRRLVETTCADNRHAATRQAVSNLVFQVVHRHLGLFGEGRPASLTLSFDGGQEQTLPLGEPGALTVSNHDLVPVPSSWAEARRDSGADQPMYLTRTSEPYWFEMLDADGALYVQFNVVRDGPEETFAEFCARLFEEAQDFDFDRIILDLRHNGGGNNYLNQPLVHGLIRCDALREHAQLFVLTSPRTFSAAMACSGDIEARTHALFVGEPTGAGPNHSGDADTITLPRTGIPLRVSKLWWQWSDPRDARRAISPDLPAPVTFADYRAGRDAALTAALDWDRPDDLGKRTAPNVRWYRDSQRDAPTGR